ncbi:PulJ/GspJ family protein [Pseudoduganella sp. R-34]|uniref:PulJ/GspJ family protein n=1 Tax=Pseudoduganella sp. R-34 TaxID=3404062 RepID=UPI003CFA2AC2
MRPNIRSSSMKQGLRSQAGFALLELTLALIISAVIAAAGLEMNVQANRMVFAQIEADNLATLAAAGSTMASEKFTELQTGTAITRNGKTLNAGVNPGQTYAPAIADLIAMGYLSASFPTQAVFSNGQPGNYQVRIWREPAGCELVQVTSCDVVGWVYIDRAITANGSTDPDGPSISTIVKKLGGAGGFSLNINPGTVNGLGKTWSRANPVAGNPAGVVAARFGYVSSGLGQFVRVNDTRDPNLRGKLTVQNETKSDFFYTDVKTVGAACSQENAIASTTSAVVVCSGGTWQAISARANPADGCAPDGKVATSTATGEQLICKNGRYVKSTSLLPQSVVKQRVAVRDLDVVNKPTCDVGGTPDRSFSLTQTSIDVTNAPPKQSMFVTTVDLGGAWQVLIKIRDDSGGEASGNAQNISAVLNLECKY